MGADAATGSSRDIPALIEAIRQLLEMPKKARPADWEASIGRYVGLLSTDYPQQTDARIALVELAVLGHADAAGSKEAKKRVHAPRWNEAPPSVHATLSNPAERKAAIKALSRIRAEWCTPYAISELSHPDSKATRGDLIGWAARSSPSWAECLDTLREALPALQDHIAEVIRGFSDVARSDVTNALSLGQAFLEALGSLGREVAAILQQRPESEKQLSASLSSLGELADIALAREPGLAFNSAIGGALEALSLGKSRSKPLKQMIDRVAFHVASILGLLYMHGGPEARAETASIARSLAGSSTVFRDQAELAVRGEIRLRGLLDEQVPFVPTAEHPVEEALCSLILEMDELANLYPRDDMVAQARTRVEALAKSVHVERLGRADEICSFDPFRHLLPAGVKSMSGKVRIEKSGLVVKRSDGSERVLQKAVASLVNA